MGHTLHHSVAYRMLHAYDGYTLYNVRNRLRHSRLSTTEQRYDHFDSV
jgi:integrase/recombinase XerC/integrase/recombinase XerD